MKSGFNVKLSLPRYCFWCSEVLRDDRSIRIMANDGHWRHVHKECMGRLLDEAKKREGRGPCTSTPSPTS